MELRWYVDTDIDSNNVAHKEKPVLQYRELVEQEQIGYGMKLGWTEWQDVPTVIADEP